MRTVAIPGKAYEAAIAGSGVPGQEGWPEPTMRRRGSGWQAVYTVTDEQAAQIRSHLLTLGEGWMADRENRDDGRACLEAAARFRFAA